MSGLHADSERPPQDLTRDDAEARDRERREGGAARAELRKATHHDHVRDEHEEAEIALRSTPSIKAWGAMFGNRAGGRPGAPGVALILLFMAVVAAIAVIAALA